MKLTKIEIEQFGGLKNYVLELSGGPLYLYGENEAGKSTLCAFIAAMFYGLPGKVRGGGLRGDSRNLFMPWGENYMAGTLYFESGGSEYVLKRRFGSTAKGDKMTLFSAENWQEIPVEKEELGLQFLGVGEDAFRKTLFISQLGAVFEKGKEDELVSRLSNLEQSGDEDASVQKAIAELEKAQFSLVTKTGRGGVITQLDDKIEGLKTELLAAKERNRTFRNILEEIQALSAEKKTAEDKLLKLAEQKKEALSFEAYESRRKEREIREEKKAQLEKEKQSLTASSEQLEKLEKEKAELRPVLSMDQDTIFSLMEKEGLCHAMEKNLAEQSIIIKEIEEWETQIALLSEKKGSFLPIAVLVIGLILAVLLGLFAHPACFGLVLVSFAIFFFIKGRTKEREEKLELSARIAEKRETLKRLEQEASTERLKTLQDELAAILQSTGTMSISELSKRREAGKDLLYRYESLIRERERLQESVSRLEEVVGAGEEPEEIAVSYDGPSSVELDELKERITAQQLEREKYLAQLNAKVENGFSGHRSVSVIESALSDATQKRQELAEQYETICLAKKMMVACGEELKKTFAPVINQKSGALIERLTEGRYSEVRITDEYKIMLKTPDGSEIVPSEYVSAGTYDLLYFALRLAVLHTLYEEEIPLLILDDTFIQLDEPRRKSAFSYIREEKAGQILYFSCHKPPEGWNSDRVILL